MLVQISYSILIPYGISSGLKIRYEQSVGTCSSESKSYPGLHQKKHNQEVEGRDSAPLLRSGETSPGVLCPALEPPT